MIGSFEMTLAHFVGWLAAHPDSAYYVLFLGTYFETLIGTCFFIPGEIFLLGGSMLAGSHILSLPLVLVALYGGAVLGDHSSYFIGRTVGDSIFKPGRRVLSTQNYAKGEAAFAHYGPYALFFARFLGPLSWITPFLAGVYKVRYRTFVPFNLAGIVLGAGQFILAGYFLGRYATSFLPFMHRYLFLVVLLAALTYLFFHHTTRRKKVLKDKHEEKEGD